jgi:hypothetical protein
MRPHLHEVIAAILCRRKFACVLRASDKKRRIMRADQIVSQFSYPRLVHASAKQHG